MGSERNFQARWIKTPLGAIVAVADQDALVLLEFAEERSLEKELERLRKKTSWEIFAKDHPILSSMDHELDLYFKGNLEIFRTPFSFEFGTSFQRQVWKALTTIPFGSTCSYGEIAGRIGKPKAYRAVGTANGANPLSIVIPCHRVINSDGKLGGYGGGLKRKEWLLDHEKKK